MIIEPFAGSAGYSLHYPEREIILVEKDPVIAAVWRWLIAASPDDIRSLPALKQGDKVSNYDMPQEAKWLMGFWVDMGQRTPCDKVTKFGALTTYPQGHSRCEMYIERVSRQLPAIRHWQIINGDFSESPRTAATWFIDPPYKVEGYKYKFGNHQLDYAILSKWCQSRNGQVMVCENAGAEWLPFAALATQKGFTDRGKVRHSQEVIWTNGQAKKDSSLAA